MISAKMSFLVFVLLFSLIACSQSPTVVTNAPTATFTPFIAGTQTALANQLASPTPWVAGTETAQAIASASPTPWVAGTETALAVASASPTPPPLPTIAFPTGTTLISSAFQEGTFSPVLYGSGPFLLIGGVGTEQGWLSGVHAAQYMVNEIAYDFFSPNGFFQVPGSALDFSPVCGNYSMRSSVDLPQPMIGVASRWISEKRETRYLSTDDPAYTQALMEWFQSQGNSPEKIQITRILQADLEGDGVNEVLLSASYFKDTSGHMAETGDYSIVLIRKVIGNDVITIPVVRDYYVTSVPASEMSYPRTYTLVEAVDLNRDGTLEVIVDVSRWEGGGALVYRVDGQNVREVMRTILLREILLSSNRNSD